MPILYAGIDEAGYGPLLGPLCVACAAFELPGDEPSCLWSALSGAVCREPSDRRRRVAVADSKRLKVASDDRPLRHLERGVTAFAGAGPDGLRFADDDELLGHLGAPYPSTPCRMSAMPLPVGNEAAELGIAASMVARALRGASVGLFKLAVRAISADEFNAQADRVGNKATINWMAAMQHVEAVRVASRARGLDAWFAIDQQGGRHNYTRPLATSFPEATIRVLDESDERAAYELRFERPGAAPHRVTIEFRQRGEDTHLPVALASMAAKFVRELHMRRINAFFAQHVPELKPTAGYVQDGRRFLDAIRPTLLRLGMEEHALVRSR